MKGVIDDTRSPKGIGSRSGLWCRFLLATGLTCGCLGLVLSPSSWWVSSVLAQSGMPEEAEELSAAAEDVIVDIRVEGNVTIPESAIARHIKTVPGRSASTKQIREDVRQLYSTRWFFSVEPRYRKTDEGLVLVFKVLERPMVKSVEYRGNKKIKDKYLEALTGLKPGSPYDVSANKESVRRIEAHYQEKGYSFVEVQLVSGASPDDRDVIFQIDEGPKVKVKSVKFFGNKFFSGPLLRTKLRTKVAILGLIGGKYEPSSIADDIDSLKQYYHSLGFFDAKIDRKVGFSEDRSGVYLEYHIEEGERYKVRKIEFEGNDVFTTSELEGDLSLTAGEHFNARKLQKDVEGMKDKYGQLGRLFAHVEPIPRFLEEPGEVDLVFRIDEDQVYRVRYVNVHIQGDNPHTKETVVHNRIRIHSGDLANSRLIELSKRRLEGSQVFERGPAEGPRVNISRVNPHNEPGAHQLVRGQAGDFNTEPAGSANSVSGSRPTATKTGERRTGQSGTAQSGTGQTTSEPHQPASATHFPVERNGSVSEVRPTADNRRASATGRAETPVYFQHSLDKFDQSAWDEEPVFGHGMGEGRSTLVTAGPSPKSRWEGQPSERGSLDDWTPFDIVDARQNRDETGLLTVGSMPRSLEPSSSEVPSNRRSVVRGQSFDGPFRRPNDPRYDNSPQGDPFGNSIGAPPLGWMDQPPPDWVDLDFFVNEARTGRLMFGVGVNSDTGVVGSIVLDEQNFDILRPPRSFQDILDGTAWRGGGQTFRLEAVPGDLVSRYMVSWTEPFFLDTDYSLGVSGFYYDRFFLDWTEQRAGGRVSVGRQFTPEISLSAAIRLEEIKVFHARTPSPPLLQESLGSNFLSSVRIAAAHDTRDSAFLPAEGHFIEGSYEQAFGDFDYPRFEVEAHQYFTVLSRPDGGGRHIFSIGGEIGWTGSRTPIFERYFAGGFQTFRGFEFRGVSPREMNVAIGGQWMLLGTAEYMLPLTANDNVQLVFFSDFGTVEERPSLDDFRVTVGTGLRLTIPMMGPVPLAFDFGIPIVKQPEDERRIFSFYVGINR